MTKIAILTDSSADINDIEAKSNDIHVVRMPISINDVEYIEHDTISYNEFVEKMRQDSVCKTSQPSIGATINMYKKLLKDYDHIIHVPLSSALSGTYETALTLIEDFNNKITVLDAKHVTVPLAILCKQIRGLINEGKSVEQIKDIVENKTDFWATLLPDDLKYLKRGGRISHAAALLGNLLKIVPILKVENGGIDVYDKVRTKSKAIKVALEATTNVPNCSDYLWIVIHADCLELAQSVAKDLEEITGEKVHLDIIGSVVMSHTGPGTIGIGRIKKIENVY